MSRHSRPASASALCAASMPYSTKLRPHLPQGCMPAPSTAMSLMCCHLQRFRAAREAPATSRTRASERVRERARASAWLPLPDGVLVVVVLEECLHDELDRRA